MKKLFKISFLLLTLGWVIFMFFAVWGSNNEQWRLWVWFTGLIICCLGSFCFTALMNHKGFWLRNEVLDREIEAFKKAKEQYLKMEKDLAKTVIKYQEKIDKLNTKQNDRYDTNKI
jgi:hypothetical protein